ncbi:MAG: hypothetical protein ACI9TH_004362 [Kiritimatiellia bacterium]
MKVETADFTNECDILLDQLTTLSLFFTLCHYFVEKFAVVRPWSASIAGRTLYANNIKNTDFSCAMI